MKFVKLFYFVYKYEIWPQIDDYNRKCFVQTVNYIIQWRSFWYIYVFVGEYIKLNLLKKSKTLYFFLSYLTVENTGKFMFWKMQTYFKSWRYVYE